MTNYDVFNGDTDGIFAWHQLRLAHPREAKIVTGVKRDVNLASRVDSQEGDLVTIMDVSHAKNRKDVQRILDSGAIVEYFDHHDPKELIEHPNITYHINTEPNISTGLIVNSHVKGQNRLWSIATAFGDNHIDLAMNMAKSEGLSDEQVLILKQIGLVVNYNSYGQTVDDLFFSPEEIAEAARACGPDIFNFLEQGDIFSTLLENFNADIFGPLAFDNSVSKKSATIKGIKNEVAGDADVLLVPNVEAGNALVKMMIYFMGACAAGVVVGGKVPVVITSRSDDATARLASIAAAVVALD